MRWSLATQLRLGFAAAFLLVLGVCGATWWVALNYHGEIDVAYETHLRTAVQLAEARSTFWELRYALPQFMIGSAEEQQRILGEQDKWYAIVEERLAAYGEAAPDAEERRTLTSLRSAYQRYKQVRPKFFELWAAGQKDEAIAWRALTTTPFAEETVRAFGTQIGLQHSLAEREHAEADQKVRVALGLVTAITIALLGMLAIGYAYSVRMLRPIRALRAQAERVVREQLDETIDASTGSNEVAALVESFQLMSGRLLARTESLRQSRERLDFLLRATPAVIYAAKAGGDYPVIFVSANVRAVLGWEPEDFLRDPAFWSSNIHPDDRERVLAGLAASEREDRQVYEYRFRHRDGSWPWVHDNFVLIRDSSGAPSELVGYWIDVTERKKAADALRESEARHMAVIESALDAIIVNDEEGRITEFNPAAERTFGFRRDEVLGKSLDELLIPGGDGGILRQRFREGLASGTPEFEGHRVEVSALHADGHEFPIELIVQRIDSGGQIFFTAFARDITERNQARIALEQTYRMKSEFMANVTHELRTPLNAVIGFAELLKDEVPGPLNAKQAEFAADILASGRRLLALVEGILEMSRLDAPGAALEREPVEIGSALTERVGTHRAAAEAQRVRISLEVAADIGSAELDPKALRRMLDALLDNAIKFNREGGQVAVSARRAGGALEIAVADTGIGIARENMAKIFKPLAQLDAGLARQHAGIGLGLALARRLAELHGGTIEVESEPGKGSTFTLRLPCCHTGLAAFG